MPVYAPTRADRANLDEMVEALSAELDDVATLLTDSIHEHLDELDEDLHVMTRQSVRANLGLIVTMLREGRAPATALAPEEALAYVREYVRRGLGLEVLQRAYRTAQAALSQLVLDRLHAASDDAEELVAAFGFFNEWLFGWVEALERQLTEVYMRERERWVRSAAAVRAAEVRALLEGARPNPAETSRRLGYDLERLHVAFVVWPDAPDGDGQELFEGMERLAGAVTDALGAGPALTVPQGRHLACWAAVSSEPPELTLPPHPGMRVALGGAAPGIDGFCRSHREALLARRVARLCRGRGCVTRFADVALDALATCDLDEARRFVARELGPLAADDDATRRLSATLRVFLEESSSFVRAARRLGVHENTVAYRVHRAEELLGHRVAERALELQMALRLARLAPPAAPAP